MKHFVFLNLIREEIGENFPYKVIKIDGCEADDVIGTLVIDKSVLNLIQKKS